MSRLPLTALLAALSASVALAQAPGKPKPKPADPPKVQTLPDLDDATITAYAKLGGKYGAFRLSMYHVMEFLEGKNKCEPGMMVGFNFSKLPKGDLTDAKAPFALGLAGAGVTNAEIKRLKGLNNLAWLNLSDSRLGDAGVKELADLDLKGLTYLNINNTQVTKEGLKSVGKMKPLTVLHLGNLPLADADLAALKDLTNLTTLALLSTQATVEGLKVVKPLEKLTQFSIDSKTIDDKALRTARELNALHKLPICGGESHKPVNADADITSVGLALTGVTTEGLKELKGLKNLARLGMKNEMITDATLKVLREQGQLFAFTGFTDKSGKPVKKAEDVVQITLVFGTVSDDVLKGLKEFKNVENLYLNYTPVTDKIIPDIKAFPKLTFIQLIDTKVTADGVKELKAAFPKAIVSK